MKRKAEEMWRTVSVGKVTCLDGTSMGVRCLTGGLCRSHDGAAGFVVDCEERQCSGKTGDSSLFVPVTRNRLWVLKVVGGLSAVKGDFKFSNI